MSIQALSAQLRVSGVKHCVVIAKTSVLEVLIKARRSVDNVDLASRAGRKDVLALIAHAKKCIEQAEDLRPELSLELYQENPSAYKAKIRAVIAALTMKARTQK